MGEVHGLNELLDRMDALPLTMQRTLIVRAAREAGNRLSYEMSLVAPRGDEAPHAADSFVVVVADQSAQGVTLKIGPSKKGFYLWFLELGTYRIAAQGFMRRTFDSMKDTVINIFATRLGNDIERELKKGL